jgi:flagellar basal-body rod modification protein FlgD
MTSPTTSATGSSTTASSSQIASPGGVLGKDAFMQLLAKQMQYQDPMNPMDNTQFVAQMAQFSSLEQMTNISAGIDTLNANTRFQAAIQMIGRELAYLRADGSQGSGIATAVSVGDTGLTLTVGSDEVSPEDVTSIADAPATASGGTTTTSGTGSTSTGAV